MAYLGLSPSNGVRKVHTYTATASQTTFSGAGAENISLSYRDSTYIDVYQNGVKLGDADYTATSGTSVVLGTGATASDLVVVVVYDVFSVADTVSKTDGGQFDGNVTMAGTLGVTGAVTANAGVNIDNITIDGTEIDLSSGDLTVDVAGDITLNADGGDIKLSDGSTTFGELTNNPNADGNFDIRCPVSDADIRIKGVDGGSNVQAVLFDMSDAGTAVFNHNVRLAVDDSFLSVGASDDFIMFHDGTDSHLLNSTGDLIINSAASDEDIIFKVNDGGSSTETARFDASFDAFVLRDGGGAAVSAGKLEINASGSSYNLIALKTTRTSTGTNFIEFFNSSGTNAGEINHNGSTTVNKSTSSDYRIKENVTYDFDATSRLKQLKPARFNFIADPDVTMDGFLAHEVKDIVPIAVNGDKDEIKKWNKEEIERGFAPDGASEGDNKLDDDGNPIPKYQGIDNSHLVPLLTKALQEALTRIDTLEAEVKTLKGE